MKKFLVNTFYFAACTTVIAAGFMMTVADDKYVSLGGVVVMLIGCQIGFKNLE